MQRIDNQTAAPTLTPPAPPGTPGYFTNGSPLTGQQPTVVDGDWMNSVQEEIAFVIETSGLALNKADRTQLYQAITRLTRLRLGAPATFWCDPGGNDNAAGTAADPWATPTHAYNFIRDRIDQNGFQCAIQLNNGTYDGVVCSYPAVGPWVTIIGNQTDPTQTTLHGVSGPAMSIEQGAGVVLNSLRLTSTGPAGSPYAPSGFGINIGSSFCTMQNLFFDVCTEGHIFANVGAGISVGAVNEPVTIIGGAPQHLYAIESAAIGIYGASYTIYNNPNFPVGFAVAAISGAIDCRTAQFAGTCTGPRYNVSAGGTVGTNTGNPNFLPGDAPGVNSGGYYT